jgi:hypothetical protein
MSRLVLCAAWCVRAAVDKPLREGAEGRWVALWYWHSPGNQPIIVSKMFSASWPEQPVSSSTGKGGKMIACEHT